jgi:hypothetical protein
MVVAAREDGRDEALSAETRDRILNAASRGGSSHASFPAVFTPTRRLLVAAALPVALAVALFIGFDGGVQLPPSVDSGQPTVAVFKQGDQVFFDIRNGDRQHVVCRSTEPDRFDSACGVPVKGGAYADGLQDQASLVFYRID